MATKLTPYLFATSLALVFSTTTFAGTAVEYNKHADFLRYKTYAWSQAGAAVDASLWSSVHSAIERQLATHGLKAASAEADIDVAVNAQISIAYVVDVDNLGYSGYYWRQSGGRYPPTTSVYHIPVVVFLIELVDRQSGQPVWRGVAIDYVRDQPQAIAAYVDRSARKLFKKLPAR
jgi:hypothetical protein